MHQPETPIPRRLRRSIRLWYVTSGLLLLCCVGLALLKALPYSSCLLECLPPDQLPGCPTPNFTMGSLHWSVDSYATDPRLEPFRAFFRQNCPEETGLPAARSISDRLAELFPFGDSSPQFLDARYDPLACLRNHLHGEPGHCVHRSGLLATTLLSVGIPARVVQFLPNQHPDSGGHTVVEVWDQTYGWVVFDPSYGGLLTCHDRYCSAADALRWPDQIKWLNSGKASCLDSPLSYYETQQFPLHCGHLSYPEPWLYLRVGQRASYWPFRGKLVQIGAAGWRAGPAQTVLRLAIAATALSAIVSAGLGVLRLTKRRKPPSIYPGSPNTTAPLTRPTTVHSAITTAQPRAQTIVSQWPGSFMDRS